MRSVGDAAVWSQANLQTLAGPLWELFMAAFSPSLLPPVSVTADPHVSMFYQFWLLYIPFFFLLSGRSNLPAVGTFLSRHCSSILQVWY